jgi:Zn-dependent protease
MRTHLRLGRLLGVPIGINISVVLVALLLAVSLAMVSLPNMAPGHPRSAYWFAAVLGVLAFLGSLVAHEMGHSYVAIRNDVRVREVTLWLFGGVAKLEGDADDPRAEFRIAAAGPAMSALSSAVAGGLAWSVWRLDGSRVLFALLIWLVVINAVLAVSNLIPAFPLDGGRILRAVAPQRTQGDRNPRRRALGPDPGGHDDGGQPVAHLQGLGLHRAVDTGPRVVPLRGGPGRVARLGG